MKNFLIIVLIIIAISQNFGQSGQWVETEGRYIGANVTPEEGQKRALELARSEAIKKAVGVRITEETFRSVSESQIGDKQNDYFDIFSRLGRSTSTGKILEEKYEFQTLVENNFPVYYVKLNALVAEEKGEPDPNFKVNIFMPREVFYDRGNKQKSDNLEFKIDASEDCYIYLFNILANDSVQLLIPNNYLKDNYFLPANAEQEYEKKIRSMGMSFTVGLPPGKVSQTEALYVVALKEKNDFTSVNLSKDDFSVIPTYKAAITDIMNWLIQINPNKRTEYFKSFEIRKL